jgi:alpha-D-ribose 1-methylphosphonate 5-triphosphate synthase subunit PhnL
MRQFVEVMKSLYANNKVDESKIVELFKTHKITEEEKWEILKARKGA